MDFIQIFYFFSKVGLALEPRPAVVGLKQIAIAQR